MEGLINRSIVAAVAVVFAAAMLTEVAAEVRYTVGDGNGGWSPRDEKNSENYTVWAQDKHFYVNDWLYFLYDRYQQNVLQVNESDYDSCNSDHVIHNWSTGAGRDVVQLNQSGTYYFISGKGFCWSGMKLEVHVENPPPPPSSSPSPKKSDGARLTFGARVFAVGVAWGSLLMIM